MLSNYIDLEKGILENYTERVIRRASDMLNFYQDEEALKKMIENGDPIIYEVYGVTREGEGELSYAITILHPGKVGDEYFMTKGHYHEKRNRGELYIGLQGKGLLLIQKENEVKWIEMDRGKIVYVPPYFAHRSINIGNDDFVFLAIYPGDAGHNYGSIAEKGFAKIVVKDNGNYAIKDNPKWK